MSEINMISVEAAAAEVLGYIRSCEMRVLKLLLLRFTGPQCINEV
jgi:hypothetical protein